jgi:hypothetical protein
MKKIAIVNLVILLSACGKIELSPHFGDVGCLGCGYDYNSISISNTFSPDSLTVKKGTTVTWNNFTNDTHNLVAGTNASFTANILPYGQFKYTTLNSGELKYHCSIHNEKGTVIITP